MNPSCARLTPRVLVVYAPARCACSQSATEAMWKIRMRSEQPVLGVVHAAQAVVVDDRAGDAAVLGEHPRLRLDQLGREDAAHRALGGEQRLPVEQLEVAGQLLDAVDLAAALD